MGAPGKNKDGMVCPFCNWESTTTDEYAIMLHMETNHAEGDSPFVVTDEAAAANGGHIPEAEEEGPLYIECPAEDCGEVLLAADLDYHLELHAAEQGSSASSETETGSPVLTPSTPSPSPKVQSPPARRPTHATTRTPTNHSSTSSPRHSTTSSSKAHRGETERHRRGERKGDHHSDRDSDRSRDSSKSRSIWRAIFGMHHHSSHSSDAPSSMSPKSPKLPKKRHRERMSGRLAERASETTAQVVRGTRLGKAQLGKYAHEEQMPDWLVKHLEKGLYVKSEGVIPVLAQLFERCSSTRRVFLCHPSTNHVSKLRKEGGFCGYRNIQMLSSYIINTKYPGHQHFCNEIPTIFDIQEMIETAWDHGINPNGRVETGGIRGTRKYIGTPEALVIFRLLQIPFDVQAFKDPLPGQSEKALLDMVERYFQAGIILPATATTEIQKVWQTDLPPIYFQHAGHSMTIIGLERDKSGARNLIVFDPMFHDASTITRLIGKEVHPHPMAANMAANMAVNPYRRGSKYLGKYEQFEVIRLLPRPEIRKA